MVLLFQPPLPRKYSPFYRFVNEMEVFCIKNFMTSKFRTSNLLRSQKVTRLGVNRS
jgi:hypothetical protein